MHKPKHGFTLIELLVVIGVIAVILAVAVPNFLGARERANDAKKKAELDQVKKAMRIYYNDYEQYPAEVPSGYDSIGGCGNTNPPTGTCDTSFSTSIGGNSVMYMKNLPDFNGTTAGKAWSYRRPTTDEFCLWAELDNKGDGEIAVSQSRCGACMSGGYGIQTGSDYVVCAD